MAYGGVAVNTASGARPGQSAYNINEVSGVTLAAYVAGPPAVRANADTGVSSSNRGAIDAVPANTISFPAAFGPGQDNWSASDVEALTVIPQANVSTAARVVATKALVANVNPAPDFPVITNSNVEVIVQNLGAGAIASGLTVRCILEHTAIR